ncbi:hypothetical protein A6770_22090 [Nostoc minutum NIES-26]|uniref:Uncharacterized protein n=1 Tax=Nostoc minutum NIES-26 TaxID=1844469 RepID=A0A367R1J3_9NOSO|nr:hypothetical protein A6770_22090 [Nostoc minutum NIES-26]
MNINLHIERLILDGVNISPSQRTLLQAAVEAELTRLLAQGLAPGLLQGDTIPSVTTGNVQITTSSNPTVMGQQIAQAVYRGIGS